HLEIGSKREPGPGQRSELEHDHGASESGGDHRKSDGGGLGSSADGLRSPADGYHLPVEPPADGRVHLQPDEEPVAELSERQPFPGNWVTRWTSRSSGCRTWTHAASTRT